MLTAALATAAIAAPGSCAKADCVERVAARWCEERGRVASCIHRGAIRWNVSHVTMRRRAWCESRFNRFAHNPSGASGLFQFLPSTWATTPYAGHSVWSAKWSSLAAAWMQHVGRGGEWICQ